MKTSFKKLAILSGLLLGGILGANAQVESPTFEWTQKAGGSGFETPRGIVTDANGNSFVIGHFRTESTFGEFVLDRIGKGDAFLIKLNTNGDFIWATQVGGTLFTYGNSITLDADGNIYIVGEFTGETEFDNITLTSNGDFDMFVAKLDGDGNFLWATNAGGLAREKAHSVAVDTDGNVYVTGQFTDEAIFGEDTLNAVGSDDIYVAKLNVDGDFVWATQAGGNGEDNGRGITVDNSGNVFITGNFKGTATFGSTSLTSTGGKDIFVAKLDNDGAFIWAHKAGSNGEDEGIEIDHDQSGNVYVTGYFNNTASFGNTSFESIGVSDIFVTKLNTDGDFIWTNQIGGTGQDYGEDIKVDADGYSYIAGRFYYTIQFGNESYTVKAVEDAVAFKLGPNGEYIWAQTAGGNGADQAFGIGVDAVGNAYVTGVFSHIAMFGNDTLQTYGQDDVFISKLNSEGLNAIDPLLDDSRVQVYPNPANDLLQVHSDGLIIHKYALLDVKGAVIMESEINHTELEIRIQHLHSGIYFLMLDTDKGSVVKKLIKK